MPGEVKKFPITGEFRLESHGYTTGAGDTLELVREVPARFFQAQIVKKGGEKISVPFGVAEMMFRNGLLG